MGQGVDSWKFVIWLVLVCALEEYFKFGSFEQSRAKEPRLLPHIDPGYILHLTKSTPRAWLPMVNFLTFWLWKAHLST